MLIRNFFRDIFSTLPRLLAVIIVTALGVMVYVGMGGCTFNLMKIAESYYTKQNVADYWIYGSNLTKLDERKIARLPSVKNIQTRVNAETEYYGDKNISLSLHGISGDIDINKPDILSGRMFRNNRECMLDATHAKAHNLSVGDKLELKIKGTDIKLAFTICALVNSPEYINNVSGLEIIPNSYRSGFGYVREDALGNIKSMSDYNEFDIILKENADATQFKKDIEDILGTRLIKALSFKDNIKAYMLIDQIEQTKALTTILPILFFLIAAFIMFTTMSRVVENNRMMIGTLKALGYKKITIYGYFLAYALTVVVFGTVAGVLPARLITKLILEVMGTLMVLPKYTVKLDTGSIMQVVFITTAICTGTAAFVCGHEIKYTPAECMRPKSPKASKGSLIEGIKIIWSRLNFVQKTITRNIMRNKMRLVMCVIGVAGCMSIVITAYGLMDSFDKFINSDIRRYDLQAVLGKGTSSMEAARINKLAGIDEAEYVMDLSVKVSKGEKQVDTTLNVLEDTISLLVLSEDVKGSMDMPEDGAIISSILAEKLDVHKGDIVNLVIAGKTDVIKTEVSDIKDNINDVNLGKGFWRRLGQEYYATGVYIKTANAIALQEELKEYDFVITTKLQSEVTEAVNEKLKISNILSLVLIIFGGILALVVLYNLGIMNYYERMRELATLKVLGFLTNEIKMLVLRENIIFTCIGIVIGIPFGIVLHSTILAEIVPGEMIISPFIRNRTFTYSGGLTFIFAVFVNILLGRKLRQIDMLGALKSVE